MIDASVSQTGPDKPTIQAIPTIYSGTTFRSSLEAGWAKTFDALGWYWEYEPLGISFEGIWYRPDFYLPSQRVWCEVKGPHNERLDKAAGLLEILRRIDNYFEPLVVILRPPGPGDAANWHRADSESGPTDVIIRSCEECEHYGFVDLEFGWECRRCGTHSKPQESIDVLQPFDGLASWKGFPLLTYQRVDRGRNGT